MNSDVNTNVDKYLRVKVDEHFYSVVLVTGAYLKVNGDPDGDLYIDVNGNVELIFIWIYM